MQLPLIHFCPHASVHALSIVVQGTVMWCAGKGASFPRPGPARASEMNFATTHTPYSDT
jgi:hypothetical protein